MRAVWFNGSDFTMLNRRLNALAARPARRQQGLSIVEMMVGVAVGLFVVAAATTVSVTQITENRRLMLETQLHQDMRATTDIVTRELRRASFYFAAPESIWINDASTPATNPSRTITPSGGAGAQTVGFSYDRAPTVNGPFGFRYSGGNKVGSQLFSGSVWQDLTDSNTMNVKRFWVDSGSEESAKIPCPKLCPDGTTECWPTVSVREYVISITAEAKSDAGVARAMSSRVRIRNDAVNFKAAGNVCPV